MSCPGFWLTPYVLSRLLVDPLRLHLCSKRCLRRNPAGGKFLATVVVSLGVKVLALGVLGVVGARVLVRL